MKTFKFVVSTPEGSLFHGDVVSISLRGQEGDLAIMANHTPFATAVKPCRCAVAFEDGSNRHLRIERGLLSVSAEVVNLMSGSAQWE